MPSNPPPVPGLFPAPCRDIALKAVSRAVLRVLSNGESRKSLAKKIAASVDVIDSAIKEESMLNFTSIARLGYHFPEEFKMIEALWTCAAPVPVTALDRLERIERETAAMRKALV